MSKIDESRIISYLYNELKGEEKQKFEKELKENPEWQKQIEEFRSVREALSKVEDQSMPEPAFVFPGREKRTVWKHWMSIAASVVILFVFIVLSGFKAGMEEGELRIGFGKRTVPTEGENISREELEGIIAKTLQSYDSKMENKMVQWNDEMTAKIGELEKSNKVQMQEAVSRIAKTGETRVNEYIARLTESQKSEFLTMLATHSEDQEEVMKKMLLDFGSYLDDQREADMEYLETYITSVQNESREEQIQTRQFIENIFTQTTNRGIAD